MKIHVCETEQQLGIAAAEVIAAELKEAIEARGNANYLVSTGASQFSTFEALIRRDDIDWSKVTMYHLDEYANLPESHIASFRRYLKERFVEKVPIGRAVFINGEGDLSAVIAELEAELAANPIDVGAIGIGENAHIAFNDPPAMFDKQCAYHVVNLSETCKQQQVNEGWFDTLADVPVQAISMTPCQIMKCRKIVSAVPGKRKAEAIFKMLSHEQRDPMIPATLLREHPCIDLFLDQDSASLCSEELLNSFCTK